MIPKKALHGKLVTFCTPGAWDEGPDSGDDDDDDDDDEALDTREGGRAEYKVIGLPMVIDGQAGQYQRNQYMWNLCFVFRADASLEAFEPVVRKTARILKSAEVGADWIVSRVLTSPGRLGVSFQPCTPAYPLAGYAGTAVRGSQLVL